MTIAEIDIDCKDGDGTCHTYSIADIIIHMLVIFIVSAALFGIEEIAEHLVCMCCVEYQM
jgi:hypothetical protein